MPQHGLGNLFDHPPSPGRVLSSVTLEHLDGSLPWEFSGQKGRQGGNSGAVETRGHGTWLDTKAGSEGAFEDVQRVWPGVRDAVNKRGDQW